MSKSYGHLILISTLLFVASCGDGNNRKLKAIERVYNNRSSLLTQFTNRGITVRGNLVIAYLYGSDSSNLFSFRYTPDTGAAKDRKYSLIHYGIKDSSTLALVDGLSKKSVLADTVQLAGVLETYIKNSIDTMTLYSIKEFTSEFKKQGVTLKFYLDNNTVIFYVYDPSAIMASWKHYVAGAKKLDTNWYYYLEDI